MKKKTLFAGLLAGAMIFMTGCKTTKSYTFTLETGDSIKVELDTSDGWEISQNNGQFTIKNTDSEEEVYGLFIDEDRTDQLIHGLSDSPEAEIFEQDEESIFYSWTDSDGTEYDFVSEVKGASAGVALTSSDSKECVQSVLERLQFTAEN